MTSSHGTRATGLVLTILASGWGCSDQPSAAEVDPFEWVKAGLLSKNKNARKQSFEQCRTNWAQVRGRIASLLQSDEPTERLAGTYLFSRLGSESDLPLLRRCLTDSSQLVQLTAVNGVHRLKDRGSVPHLVALLGNGLKYRERGAVLRVLASLDREAAGSYCAILAEHEGWAQRRNAAETLGLLTDEDSRELLLRMIDDPVWMVRIDAAVSLAHRKVPAARTPLLAMTRHDMPKLRAAAARCLASLGRTEDVDVVGRMSIDDQAKIVRIAATAALGDFPEHLAFPLVERVLRKPGEHRKVRFAAIRALRMFPSEAARDLARTTVAADNDLQALIFLETGGRAQPGKE